MDCRGRDLRWQPSDDLTDEQLLEDAVAHHSRRRIRLTFRRLKAELAKATRAFERIGLEFRRMRREEQP